MTEKLTESGESKEMVLKPGIIPTEEIKTPEIVPLNLSVIEMKEEKRETTIEKVMIGVGHQGRARFQFLVDDADMNFSEISISRREEIRNVIVEIINKIGNSHGISLRDINVDRAYGRAGSEETIDGIEFRFDNSDSDSDIKGDIYIGFLGNGEKPIYIFHTHVDLLEKLTMIELNKFAKELRQTVKNNKLKIYLKGHGYSETTKETTYGDPVIYRIGKTLEVDEFIEFLKDIEVIANKFPLCRKVANSRFSQY